MDKTQTTVRIAGQDFRINGTETEEYIQSVAQYVDDKVGELQDKYPSMSSSVCMILTAINLADELFKMKAQYAELDKRIEELRQMPRMEAPQRPQKAKVPVKRPFEKETTL